MRMVEWKDGNRIKRSWIKDEDPDDAARYGIPAEMPDLERLDWEGIKGEIRVAMESAGIYTWLDVERSQAGLTPALSIFKRHLIRLYREDGGPH